MIASAHVRPTFFQRSTHHSGTCQMHSIHWHRWRQAKHQAKRCKKHKGKQKKNPNSQIAWPVMGRTMQDEKLAAAVPQGMSQPCELEQFFSGPCRHALHARNSHGMKPSTSAALRLDMPNVYPFLQFTALCAHQYSMPNIQCTQIANMADPKNIRKNGFS